MSDSTPLYNQLFSLLSQYSKYRDLRHLKALVWMIIGLIQSGKISLSEWECYIPSRARKAQSFERRWQRFVSNQRIRVRSLYVPLVLGAIKNWHYQRLYLALDTTNYALESVLHYSPFNYLRWKGSTVSVESART